MDWMGRWQRDLSAPPGFANRWRLSESPDSDESLHLAPAIHRLWAGNFPLWTESRIPYRSIWPNAGHWVIPAFALGRYRLFHRLFHRALMSLILASNSQIRGSMLDQAGSVRDPVARVRRSFGQAGRLGRRGSWRCDWPRRRPLDRGGAGDWVIGSDSTVSVDGARYSKPRDREQAAATFAPSPAGRCCLSSAVALARQGQVDWSHAETAG